MTASFDQQVARTRSLSFDCYGTLIDWISGIRAVFDALAASGEALPLGERAFFDTYLAAEAEAEAGPYMPYRQVLTCVQRALADRFALRFGPDDADLLARSQADWKPFADTNAALVRLKSRYRLGILSNIDNDLFAATAGRFRVAFDFVITGEDVGAYKPAHAHFARLLQTEVDQPNSHIHVAQSLFHDGVPSAELGIPFVWINRRDEVNDTTATPLAAFDNLTQLADRMGV